MPSSCVLCRCPLTRLQREPVRPVCSRCREERWTWCAMPDCLRTGRPASGWGPFVCDDHKAGWVPCVYVRHVDDEEMPCREKATPLTSTGLCRRHQKSEASKRTRPERSRRRYLRLRARRSAERRVA